MTHRHTQAEMEEALGLNQGAPCAECDWYVMNAHHHGHEVVVGLHCRRCPNAAFRRLSVADLLKWESSTQQA